MHEFKLLADRKIPNSNGWQDRHDTAVRCPAGFEWPIVRLLEAWQEYAVRHQARYESKIGDDGVLGAEWLAVGVAVLGLLNGECGRLDCGTLDGFIRDFAKANNAEIPE